MLPRKIILTISILFFCRTIALADEWKWVADQQIFNPSGIEIDTLNFDFQFIDWDNDGLLELLIHHHHELRLYKYNPLMKTWKQENLNLPVIQPITLSDVSLNELGTFLNFSIVDIDQDGDWDIISDSLKMKENIGTNQNPVWIANYSFFNSKIEPAVIYGDTVICNLEPRFFDFDSDGDFDLLANSDLWNTYLFVNKGGLYQWWLDDSLLSSLFEKPYNFALIDFDDDRDLDCFCHDFPLRGTDLANYYYLYIHENTGDNQHPEWQYYNHEIDHFTLYRFLKLNYQFVDFDGDLDKDFIFTTPNRHLKMLDNVSGEYHSIKFDDRKISLGRLNVESDAMPFLYPNNDSTSLLIVSENYVHWYFATDMFTREFGRQRIFGDWNCFNHDFQAIQTWEESQYSERKGANKYPGWDVVRSVYRNFFDIDNDGIHEMVISYFASYHFETKIAYKIECYFNRGTTNQPRWEADSVYLAPFDASPQKFSKPSLVDLDMDNDMELVIKKGECFVCYRNNGSIHAPNWQESPGALNGIDNLNRFHLTFADLDRDGDPDAIFGNTDGTLDFFENLYDSLSDIKWLPDPEVFQHLDFGSNAAPVFGDIDNDGDLDLIVGNKNGFLYYYRNESIITGINENYANDSPERFVLDQNYPNPFNSDTVIQYSIPRSGQVELAIYNLQGKLVRKFSRLEKSPGSYSIIWDAKNDAGLSLASGVYFYQFKFDNVLVDTKKMVLMK